MVQTIGDPAWSRYFRVAGGMVFLLRLGVPEAFAAPDRPSSKVDPPRASVGQPDSPPDVRHVVFPRPSLLWTATQLVPSIEMALGPGDTHYGLRWQITPLLWSWGVHRKLSGWRTLVVEPNVRHSGSLELYATPGFYMGADSALLLRVGARAYFPVLHSGEYLSVSFGSAYQHAFGQGDMAFEVGMYVLYGVLGLQLSMSPEAQHPAARTLSLNVRYF